MLSRLTKYHSQFNTIDAFKCIAVLAMIIDHVGLYLLNDNATWRMVGRIAAPLFFFLAGYNAKNYQPIHIKPWRNWLEPSLNLIIFGLILTTTDFLIYKDLLLNILLNIFFIRQYLQRFSPKNWPARSILLLIIFILLFNSFIAGRIEYGLLGLSYAIGAQLLRENRRPLASSIFLMTLIAQFTVYWHQYKSHHGFLIGIFVLIWLLLTSFQPQEIKVPAKLKNFLLFCSRYSFEIYFAHLFLLEIYTIIFFPNFR